MLVVLDTNVIVSALWSRNGQAAHVFAMFTNGLITPCYDQRVLTEYREVLKRPKFKFSEWEIDDILAQIERLGYSVIPEPLDLVFADAEDLKFYEVAKHCRATLITGNLRHFPDDPLVTSISNFLGACLS